jgi:hypothetical protein
MNFAISRGGVRVAVGLAALFILIVTSADSQGLDLTQHSSDLDEPKAEIGHSAKSTR